MGFKRDGSYHMDGTMPPELLKALEQQTLIESDSYIFIKRMKDNKPMPSNFICPDWLTQVENKVKLIPAFMQDDVKFHKHMHGTKLYIQKYKNILEYIDAESQFSIEESDRIVRKTGSFYKVIANRWTATIERFTPQPSFNHTCILDFHIKKNDEIIGYYGVNIIEDKDVVGCEYLSLDEAAFKHLV